MRFCPVCSGSSFSRIWCSVVACRCGMVYDREPIPFDYSKVENYALAAPDPARTQRTLELLIPYMGKNVLEIGCGQGELLSAMDKLSSADGIDPSKANIDACNAKMLTVYQMGIEQLEPTKQYDLVVMSHVLEHVADINSALGTIRDVLPQGGHVYIEVPDATRHLDHLTVPLQEFSREHINHFSPMTLTRVLQRNGFWPVAMGSRSIAQPGGFYPAMWVVATPSLKIVFDDRDQIIPALMKRYAEESEKKLKQMALHVDRETQGPSIVWGAGILAEHLLPLLFYRPVAIVDRDRGKLGKQISGCTVGAMGSSPPIYLPIFVCSIIGKDSILQDIKKSGLANRIVTL